MYPHIQFNPAAFRHGITKANICWVLQHHLIDGLIEEDDENKYLVIGFDTDCNLLEVMYNIIDEETINVFHAMKCRKALYSLLPVEEKLWQK
jgi:uncharacterized DUF497 family protein